MRLFNPAEVTQTQYLFFTGKGGVGKTSTACATAVFLADQGKKVLLVSTDPASNLQDVFAADLDNKGTAIPEVPNLFVANLDPVEAAAAYRERAVAPYRGVLPESAIENMEEQLSGSCTTEIAAFNEFTDFLTDPTVQEKYDQIIFDTAPTGHTLRLLQLPSAWAGFIQQSKHGASCLGQLSGLDEKKQVYQQAVATLADPEQTINVSHLYQLADVVDDIAANHRKVIFTMGKGGVGKTTVAAAIALDLSKKGKKVHLATTDPAAHLKFVLDAHDGVRMSHIDEKKELKKYQDEVIREALATGISENDLDYIKEDLRSPCTQEIAVFRAFADIVEQSENEIVVIDTAPTGHTLLLLESTDSYDKELKRTQGKTPEAVKKLLPRLKSDETEVIIVTLPEATPVYEAERLEDDLKRAQIGVKWWVVNQSFNGLDTSNSSLRAKAAHEAAWINRVDRRSGGHEALIPWKTGTLKGEALTTL